MLNLTTIILYLVMRDAPIAIYHKRIKRIREIVNVKSNATEYTF